MVMQLTLAPTANKTMEMRHKRWNMDFVFTPPLTPGKSEYSTAFRKSQVRPPGVKRAGSCRSQ